MVYNFVFALEIQALLATHDLVAKEKLVKRSPDIGKALLDCIRKVTIKKDADEPLVSFSFILKLKVMLVNQLWAECIWHDMNVLRCVIKVKVLD